MAILDKNIDIQELNLATPELEIEGKAKGKLTSTFLNVFFNLRYRRLPNVVAFVQGVSILSGNHHVRVEVQAVTT
jgi:hypothetical protein